MNMRLCSKPRCISGTFCIKHLHINPLAPETAHAFCRHSFLGGSSRNRIDYEKTFRPHYADFFCQKSKKHIFPPTITEYLKFQPEEYEIDADGHLFRLKAFIVAACNASQYGNNVFIAPMASIRDGLLDITLIHAGTPLTRARAGVELVTGMIKNNMIIQTLRVKKATIRRLSPGIAHVDGEPIRLGAEINVECNHGDLLIFTTGEKKPFRPLITPFQYLHREIRTWFRSVIGR